MFWPCEIEAMRITSMTYCSVMLPTLYLQANSIRSVKADSKGTKIYTLLGFLGKKIDLYVNDLWC